MTSYIIAIKQCPKCECKFTFRMLRSCNTIRARYFTDGFIDGPMYSEGHALLACPQCRNYFWVEDVPTIGSMSESQYIRESEQMSLPEAIRVGKRDFETLLNQSFWKSEAQEKYIRIRFWWALNDAYRRPIVEDDIPRFRSWLPEKYRPKGINDEYILYPEQEINLNRLLKLLDRKSQDDRLMMAEIHRELGQFEESLKLLDQPFDDMYRVTIETIKKLATDKNRRVEIVVSALSD